MIDMASEIGSRISEGLRGASASIEERYPLTAINRAFHAELQRIEAGYLELSDADVYRAVKLGLEAVRGGQ